MRLDSEIMQNELELNKNSVLCHSEAIAEESKNAISDEMFRSAQHDKVCESNRHCERSEANAAIHNTKQQTSIAAQTIDSEIMDLQVWVCGFATARHGDKSPCNDSVSKSSIQTNTSSKKPTQNNSKILSEKSSAFFSQCGLQGKSQGSYFEGNDRRDFSQPPHLSQNEVSLEKAELLKALVTQRVYHHDHYNELWECLDSQMQGFLLECGIVGFGVSFMQRDCIAEIFRDKDVLVLSGGNDIGEYPKRDSFEFALLEYALKHDKKILAICRGMQLVATYFGLSLHKSTHAIKECHTLRGVLNHSVHSYHNFCLKSVPSGFEILAMIDDEIEAIKSKQILCFMWHPEREEKREIEISLIREFLGINLQKELV